MTPNAPAARIDGFKGINNRLHPRALGWAWQQHARNAVCDDAGYLCRRPGSQEVGDGGYRDVYGTKDGRLLLITADNALVERLEDGTETLKAEGVIGAPFVWAELGYAVFVMSAIAQWAIYPDRIIPWGALCPVVALDTYPIGENPVYPPPVGEVIAARRNQLLVGAWEPDQDRSVIYVSRPDYPHEFRLDRDFTLVPGRVTLLASVSQGVLIGTDRAIFVDAIDAPLQRIADYGVPPGGPAWDDRDTVWFWSLRGLCRALPFTNLTDAALAVTARAQVTSGVIPWEGSTYAVVHQRGATLTAPTRANTAPTLRSGGRCSAQIVPPMPEVQGDSS